MKGAVIKEVRARKAGEGGGGEFWIVLEDGRTLCAKIKMTPGHYELFDDLVVEINGQEIFHE